MCYQYRYASWIILNLLFLAYLFMVVVSALAQYGIKAEGNILEEDTADLH